MSLVDFFAHSDGQQWMAEAACGAPNVPHEWFFPDESKGETPVKAISVCNGCIVKDECLVYAVSTGQEQGVWGGKSERQRRREKRRANEQALKKANEAERSAEEART